MDVVEIISEITKTGANIQVVDDSIKLTTRVSIPSELQGEIKKNKSEIIRFINSLKKDKVIPRASSKEFYTLSSAQRRLYFLHQFDKSSLVYNQPQVIKFEGELNKSQLRKAFGKLIERHESLRTSIQLVDDEVVQKIEESVEFQLEYHECEQSEPRPIIDTFIRPFDLGKAPLIRIGLVKLNDNSHLLMLDMHHIITDGTSKRTLIRDFMTLYGEKKLHAVRLQYKDYAEWQQGSQQQAMLSNEKQFWLQEFAEPISLLDLPTDFPRPAVKGQAGDRFSFVLDKRQSDGLKALSDKMGVTPFMTVFSVFNVLLSKLSNQEDITIGTPVAGRAHPDLEEIIGMFVNTLALRNYPKGELTFDAFLSTVKENTIGCFDHQSYQYEELIEALNIPRDTSRNPLFDVMFVFQNFERESLKLPGLGFELYDTGHSASKFDLTLSAMESEGQLYFNIEYSTDLFNMSTIERFSEYFKRIVDQILVNSKIKIQELEILSSSEQHQLLEKFNNTTVDFPIDQTVINLFEEQVEQSPDKIAIVSAENNLSYAELNKRADQVAGDLHHYGIGVAERVGIFTSKSVAAVVAILGTLKAGCVYVPLDTNAPAGRLVYMLEDAGTKALISNMDLPDELVGKYQTIDLANRNYQCSGSKIKARPRSATDMAYIMYTSGTTGAPKGVMISHRNITRLVKNTNYVELNDATKILLTGAFAFDATTFEIWGSLLNGGSLVLVADDTILNTNSLGDAIVENGVNTMWLTSSLFNQHVQENPNIFKNLKYLLVGGEALSPFHINQVRELFPHVQVVNGYGPTENTTFSVCHKIDKTYETSIPIGKPINNSTAYILSPGYKVQPIGVKGELFLGGHGVGLGYLNNDALTKEKFIDDPFKPGELLYRTGDVARWDENGTIEFLGRQDKQVKIRGFRIELSEIENQLASHSSIEEAIVVVNEKEGDKLIVSYYVSENPIPDAELRIYLSAKLPEYMVPVQFVYLEKLPLTLNGKVDKRALPDPDLTSGHEYKAPSDEIEKKLVGIWAKVLKIDPHEISVDRSFFELGGHSLKATILANKISREFNVEVPLKEVFAHQNIESLSTFIKGAEKTAHSEIKKAEKKDLYVISSAQRRMYFLHEFDRQSLAYNMPQVVQLEGTLDIERLEEVFQKIVRRHESLCTSFQVIEGVVFQKIDPDIQFEITIDEASKDDTEPIISRFIRPFDLNQGPLIRVGLVKVSSKKHLLLLDMHHIITDGTSQGILTRDFMSLYNNEDLPDVALHYKDYAEWQNGSEQQSMLEYQRAFWINEFLEPVTALNLPADFARPVVKSWAGNNLGFSLSPEETSEMKSLGDKLGATMFMTVFSLFNILLSKLSNQQDITVGTPVAGRGHVDLEGMIGMFVNTVVLRNYPKGDLSFESFLSNVKEKTLACFDNQSFQYEELLEELNIVRDTGRNPLFDVMFIFQNFERQELNIPGLQLRYIDNGHSVSKFDLTLSAIESGDQLHLNFSYSTDLFNAPTIERFMRYFKKIIQAFIQEPQMRLSQVEILSDDEKQQLLYEFNDPHKTLPEYGTVIDMFEAQASKTPDDVALVFGKDELKYGAFQRQVDQMASMLSDQGIGRGAVVGLMSDRSIDLMISIFGILKSGAAYLPIDPGYPQARIDYIIQDSQIDLLLTTAQLQELHQVQVEVMLLESPGTGDKKTKNLATPDGLAYVIYTSGSTGNPKGVEVEHHSLSNMISFMDKKYPLEKGDRFLFKTSYMFDVSMAEIFGWCASGGSLVILPPGDELEMDMVLSTIEKNKVTHINFVPSVFSIFLNELKTNQQAIDSVKYIFAAGEALPVSTVHAFNALETKAKLENIYGPTEGTVYSCGYSTANLKHEKFVPIGKPLSNVNLMVLDRYGALQPVGVGGELHLAGEGVARGYRNNPGLTAEKFITNPYEEGERLYKTGDLTRWLPDGNLEFLGRIDDQIKVRGFRIELGEIESQLVTHKSIKESIVLVKDRGDDKYLIAYYVSEEEIEQAALRSHLTDKLPDYMIPSGFVQLEQFPLTPNGKISRRDLTNLDHIELKDYKEPSCDQERRLVQVWSEVLNLDASEVGVETSFFELGGHSLKAMVLANRLLVEFEVRVSLRDLFIHQDIRSLAACISSLDKTNFSRIEPSTKSDFYPLSPMQRRLYFLYEFDPESLAYNMPQTVHLKGPLNKEHLQSVFAALIDRHEGLRTSFVMVGEDVMQQINDHVDLDMVYQEVGSMQDVETHVRAFIRPFDLGKASMMRVGLVKITSESHVLMVDMHHIITDGTSQAILIKDFMALYDHKKLPPLRVQYKDYTSWLQMATQKADLSNQRSFWVNEFKEDITLLELPTDHPRPRVKNYSGDSVRFTIHKSEVDGLKLLGESQGTTMFMTVLALFNVLLSKLSGQEDIIVGTPVTGRDHPDLDGMMGMFVNTLALRNHPRNEFTFKTFLEAVRDRVLVCFEHQNYPYEDLIEALNLPRDTSRQPLFDVSFMYQSFEKLSLEIPELRLERYDHGHQNAKVDLTLIVHEMDGELVCSINYATSLFNKGTIEKMTERFHKVIAAAIEHPEIKLGEIEVLLKEDELALEKVLGDKSVHYPEHASILELFEKHAENYPGHDAIVDKDLVLSYEDLRTATNKLSYYLDYYSREHGELCFVFADSTIAMIGAAIGIMKSGKVFVPIGSDLPDERIRDLYTSYQPSWLIADKNGLKRTVILDECNVPSKCKICLQDMSDMSFYNPGRNFDLVSEDGTFSKDTYAFPLPQADQACYLFFTSGSTDKPKPILGAFKGLNHFIDWELKFLSLEDRPKVSQLISPTFDAFFRDVFVALCGGGTLFIPPKEGGVLKTNTILDWIAERGINVVHCGPSLLRELMSATALPKLSELRYLLMSGETVRQEDIKQWRKMFGSSVSLVNLYGPSETTMIKFAYTIDYDKDQEREVSIGKPIPGSTSILLDRNLKPVPLGSVGELYIKTPYRSLGYYNNESLTREVFIELPLSNDKNDFWYKTGDLAKIRNDGEYEFVGRKDHQVKVHGIRVELKAIESTLSTYGGIEDAIVFYDMDRGVLSACIKTQLNIEASEINQFLSTSLPKYMIPAFYIFQEEFPKNSNGKTDRKLLHSTMERALQEKRTHPTKAKTKLQEQLIEMWSDVLGLDSDKIGIDNGFFELGGHSLKAALLVNKISRELQVTVPLKTIFAHQDISTLSVFIEGLETTFHQDIEKAPEKEYYTLSSAQRRMYFLHAFDQDSLAYNMPQVVELVGNLDLDRLKRAFQELISRHASLRTSFEERDGIPVQIIHSNVSFDIAMFESADGEEDTIINKFICPFNLNEPCMLRVGVITKPDGTHILMVDMHHIITDGVSQGILVKDFMALYDKKVLSKVSLEYRDYAEWQQSQEQQTAIALEEAFWLQEFEEDVIALDLPTDFQRPKVKNESGETLSFSLSIKETDGLKSIVEKTGATMFMTVLAIFNVLLSKLSNREDITVGTPVAGRGHIDLEGVIGMFVNTLTLRNYPQGALNFEDFLSEVKLKFLSCLDHQSYQYEELIEKLNINRDTSRNPLFDVMFVFQNFEPGDHKIPDLNLKPYPRRHTISKFDLTWNVLESPEQLHFNIEYSTELFTPRTIEKFINYFKQITKVVIVNSAVKLGEIEILLPKEKEELLYKFNNTVLEYPKEHTIIDAFQTQVRNTPEKVALTFNNEEVTYDQLNRRTNRIANYIIDEIGKEKGLVGILLDRSIDMISGILGILKSGNGYVPIDSNQPESRALYMLNESKAKVLITTADYLERYQSQLSVIDISDEKIDLRSSDNLTIDTRSSDLAYVMFTSGSTGMPKGVLIKHENVVAYMASFQNEFSLSSGDVVLQQASPSFDTFIEEVFPALTVGAELVIVGKYDLLDIVILQDLINSKRVNIVSSSPLLLNELNKADLKGTDYTFISGGDVLKMEYITNLMKIGKVYNTYGPTEGTVCATYYHCVEPDGARIPIGKPIANKEIYILNKYDKLQPIGVQGELCIGGEGLAIGYLNNDTLTAEKFISNPFKKNGRLYRTGDLARWMTDGNVEFLGRVDDQVQIRGYRIEVGEVESHLVQHSEINEAIVLAREVENDRQLIAYYVSYEKLDLTDLKHYLSAHLPDYMVPSYFVHLEHFPLNSNGKIDRRALPQPEIASAPVFVAARTKEEKLLSQIWSQVLGVEHLGVTDNFFSVGGDSIKSIQISSRVRSAGYSMSVKDIFTSQTIEELSLKLKESIHTVDQSEVKGVVTLTGIQRWFLESDITAKHHFNQSVMMNFEEGITPEHVLKIFTIIRQHHDALRMVFKQSEGRVVQQHTSPDDSVDMSIKDLTGSKSPEKDLLKLCNELQSSIDLETGPLMKLGLFKMLDGTRLVIVIHHLVIDGISWRILFEDIESLYRQIGQNVKLQLPLKTNSFQDWSKGLLDYTTSEQYNEARTYWNQVLSEKTIKINRDFKEGSNMLSEGKTIGFQLTEKVTSKLLKEVHGAFSTQVNDILLAGLLRCVVEHCGTGALKLDLEGHGREEILEHVDISRTIGWFTSIYPVILGAEYEDLRGLIKSVKESLRQIPNNGIDYLIGKHMAGDCPIDDHAQPESSISFNYLGQFDSDTQGNSFKMARESTGSSLSMKEARSYDWEFSGMISGGRLGMSITYSAQQYEAGRMQALMETYEACLIEIIDFCSGYAAPELTPSDLTFSALSIAQLDELQSTHEVEDVYPLSPMQEGMFFHSLLDNQANHYFEQISYRLEGELDLDSIEKSLQSLVDRYDILRTVFTSTLDPRPLQVVLRKRNLSLSFQDIRPEITQSSQQEALTKYKELDRNQKFDLRTDPLMRVSIYQIDENQYEFIWSHHHILMDGWCMSIMIQEFSALYNAHKSSSKIHLPKVSPYATYIEWLENRNKDASQQYWSQYLEGYDHLATLPKEQQRPSEIPVTKARVNLILNHAESKSLDQLARKNGVTLNTVIQSIWGILLSRYNKVDDVVFGAVVSGRPAEIDGIETMVGLFINTIPIRISIEERERFNDLILKVHNKAIEAESHHYNPLADIQSSSELGMNLLDHILVFENYPIADEIEGVAEERNEQENYRVTGVEAFEQTNYSLTIIVVPGKELRISLDYDPHVFDQRIIEGVKKHLECIIKQVNEDSQVLISNVEILPVEDRDQILNTFNGEQRGYTQEKTIVGLFEDQVEKTPGHPALLFDQMLWTYEELNNRSNQLAIRMREHGVGRNMVVAIMMDRSPAMIVALIATLKSGAAYLPVDPDYPENRVEYMLENSKATTLITDKRTFEAGQTFSGEVINIDDVEFSKELIPNPVQVNASSDLLYVIYTSGSTGKPKGVMLSHSNLTNLIHYEFEGTNLNFKKVLQFTTFSFDVSLQEIFSTLLSGGQLTIVTKEDIRDISRLFGIVENNGIETLFMPASVLNQVFNSKEYASRAPKSIQHIVTAGEQIILGEVFKDYLRENGVYLHNHYGPSETHVVTAQTIDPASIIPTIPSIGRPIYNTNIYIVDDHMNPQPVSVPGELLIGGAQVGMGYLNNDNLTSRKFLESPFKENEVVYHTGDLARWMADGTIEFLGRVDDQVKIRGHRIELGEIESHLSAYDLIDEAVVVVRQSEDDKHLITYYVSDQDLETSKIQDYLMKLVPDYMQPSFFVRLAHLPLTPSGKVDRRALPDPEFKAGKDYVAPSNEVEDCLTEIWGEVLKIDPEEIGVNTSFFELGGHSLKATIMLNTVCQKFDIEIPLREVFSKETVRLLSDYLIVSKQIEIDTDDNEESDEITI